MVSSFKSEQISKAISHMLPSILAPVFFLSSQGNVCVFFFLSWLLFFLFFLRVSLSDHQWCEAQGPLSHQCI